MTDRNDLISPTAAPTLDTKAMLDLALHMANRADEIALAGFRGGARPDIKADGSPVTRVDREIESMIRDTIEREHPQAGVLGEEYGEELGEGRWVVDPIDGTREFVKWDPRFSILIAYELDADVLLGVVSAPALGSRWWAGVGLGARRSHRGMISAAQVSEHDALAGARGMLLGGFHSKGWPGPEAAAEIEESLIADGVDLTRRGVSWEAVKVATAEFDFALTAGYRWDVAPLEVIVREAGGWVATSETPDGVNRIAVSNGRLAGVMGPLSV